MKSIQQWLDEYGESHQNSFNKIIHYICVPAIYMTVVGLFWSIPFPFADLPVWINWATIIAVGVIGFYFALSFMVGLGMFLFTVAVVAFLMWWQSTMSVSVLTMSVVVFVAAWILQFWGHKVEGKKPSFFKDVQFLLIGPAWILCHGFKKINLKY